MPKYALGSDDRNLSEKLGQKASSGMQLCYYKTQKIN